jgi:hypothetical protein
MCNRESRNRLEYLDGSPIFEELLVGFVSGADSIFLQLKEVIGEFHLTPHEDISKIAKIDRVPVPFEAQLGVISYIRPISKKTRDETVP